MSAGGETAAGRQGRASRGVALWRARQPRVALALLFLIWVALPLVPAESGLMFGQAFQTFFSVCLVLSGLFFWLLKQERLPAPSSAAGVLASVAGVYLVTVGLLVALGAAAPQFALPRPATEGALVGAAKRGEALFTKADVGCFLCHSIAGRGGTRGPDLTQIGARAGSRVPGLAPESYLEEKVRAGSTYQFKVPDYVPIMPAFGQTLSDDQVADLVEYLLALERVR